jgi:hypothetical protein
MTFSIDIAAIIIVGLIITFGLLQRFDEAAQTAALKRMADVEEEEFFQKVRESRENRKGIVINYTDWLKELTGYRVLSLESIYHDVKALSFLATEEVDPEKGNEIDSFRLVVTPLQPSELKRELASKPRPINQVPLLGYKKWFKKVPSFEKNMRNAGVYFDIDACKLAEGYGLDWGSPSRLVFYVVK